MNIYKANVIDVYELTEALNLQYGENWDFHDLTELMFGENYYDDTYYLYDYTVNSKNPTLNLINGYLQDVLDLSVPLVLVHIYW